MLVCLLALLEMVGGMDPPTQDLVTPMKEYGEACGYEGCSDAVEGVLNVHLVPHAHAELAYTGTFHQHYTGDDGSLYKSNVNMKRILDFTISALWEHEERTFTLTDLPYFFHWWANRDETVRRMVYQLVREGRLWLAGGGWSMPDEACASYHALIDSYTYALRKLNATLGGCARPLVSWQADSFAHSREVGSMLAQMAFDAHFINPISFDDEVRRMSERALEMLWRGSDDLGLNNSLLYNNQCGAETDIFTHKLFDGYWSPPGFCFGSLCSDPLIITSDSLFRNAEERADLFLSSMRNRQAPHYVTNNVLVVLGRRFGYHDAPVWYRNIDKLIHAVNERGEGKVRLFYSSPACYLKAVHRANPVLPLKQDDFVPVAYDKQSHFSGLFTSRPTLKFMARQGHVFLQMAKQLQVLARLPDNSRLFEEFNWIMGVFQDHNILSGAHRAHVKDYYTSKMYVAVQRSTLLFQQAFNKLRQAPPTTMYYRCSFNISNCAVTKGDKYFVVLYNSLSWPVTVPVRLPVVASSHFKYTILNHNHEKVNSVIIRIPDIVLNIPNRQKVLVNELVFMAEDIPALGFRSYYIERSNKTNRSKRAIIKLMNKTKSRKKLFWQTNNLKIKDKSLILDDLDPTHDIFDRKNRIKPTNEVIIEYESPPDVDPNDDYKIPDKKYRIWPADSVNNEDINDVKSKHDHKISDKQHRSWPTKNNIIKPTNNVWNQNALFIDDVEPIYDHKISDKENVIIKPIDKTQIDNETFLEDLDSNHDYKISAKKHLKKATNNAKPVEEIFMGDVEQNYNNKIFDKKNQIMPPNELLIEEPFIYDYNKISNNKHPISNTKTIEELIEDVDNKYDKKYLTKPTVNAKTVDELLISDEDENYDDKISDKGPKTKIKPIDELIDDVEQKYDYRIFAEKYLPGRRSNVKIEDKQPVDLNILDPSGDYIDYDDYTLKSKLEFENDKVNELNDPTPTKGIETGLTPEPKISEKNIASQAFKEQYHTPKLIASELTQPNKDIETTELMFKPKATITQASENNEETDFTYKPIVTEINEDTETNEELNITSKAIVMNKPPASDDNEEIDFTPKLIVTEIAKAIEATEELDITSTPTEINQANDEIDETTLNSKPTASVSAVASKDIEQPDQEKPITINDLEATEVNKELNATPRSTVTEMNQATDNIGEPEFRSNSLPISKTTEGPDFTPTPISTEINQALETTEVLDRTTKPIVTKTTEASDDIEDKEPMSKYVVNEIVATSESTIEQEFTPNPIFINITQVSKDIEESDPNIKPTTTELIQAFEFKEEMELSTKPITTEITQANVNEEAQLRSKLTLTEITDASEITEEADLKHNINYASEDTRIFEDITEPVITMDGNDKRENATTTDKVESTTYNINIDKQSPTRTTSTEETGTDTEKDIDENEIYVLSTDTYISNKYINITLDETGQIATVTLSNGIKMALSIQILFYASDDPKKMGRPNDKSPGAYIFRPMDPTPEQIKDYIKIKVLKTKIVQELHTIFADYAGFALKLYAEQPVIEIDWVVGPIPVHDKIGKDVFIRYETDLRNDGVFYTDSNGRQTIKRIRTRRGDYEPVSPRAIPGNFYPVTSKIYIEDLNKNIRFAVFNDRAQGGASLNQGQIDLMVHRRILTDDSGVQTYLNDTENGQGITVRGKHYLYICTRSHKPHKIFEKKFAKEIELTPQILISQVNPHFENTREVWLKSRNQFSAMNKKLPVGIHLLTLEQWNDDTLLIRLENYLEKTDTVKDGLKIVFLKDVFANIKIKKMEETTLDGSKWLKDWMPLQWRKKERFSKSFNDAYGANETARCDDDILRPLTDVNVDAGIKLIPQQIRTFVVWFYYIGI